MSLTSLPDRLTEIVDAFRARQHASYPPIPTHVGERPYIFLQIYGINKREWIAFGLEPAKGHPDARPRDFDDEAIVIHLKWGDLWGCAVVPREGIEAEPTLVIEAHLSALDELLTKLDVERPANRSRPTMSPNV